MKHQNKTATPQQPTGRRFLELPEVARRWACSRRYVEGLISSGVLPVFKMGKRMTRILETDIEAYENRFLVRGMNHQPGA